MGESANPFATLFPALSSWESELLQEYWGERTFCAGTVLGGESEAVEALYVLGEGRARMERTIDDSGSVVTELLGDWDFFGEGVLLHDEADRGLRVEFLEDTRVCFLMRADFHRLKRDYPSLAARVLAFLANRLSNSSVGPLPRLERRDLLRHRVFCFTSHSGGRGVTVAAANCAAEMGRRGEKVLLWEFGGAFQDVAFLFGVDESVPAWEEYVEEECEMPLDDYVVEGAAGVFLLSSRGWSDLFDVPPAGAAEKVLSIALERFDRVVLDVPPLTMEMSRYVAHRSDVVMLVSCCTPRDLKRLSRLAEGLPSSLMPRVRVLFQMRGREDDSVLPAVEASSFPVAGELPLDARIPSDYVEGRLAVLARRRTRFSRAVAEVIELYCSDSQCLPSKSAFIRRLLSWIPGRSPFLDYGIPAPLPRRMLQKARRVLGEGGYAARSRLALGEALFLQGHYLRAFQELQEAVNLWPFLSEAYVLMGEIAFHLGRRQEALRYYEAALEYDPRLPRAAARAACFQGRAERIMETLSWLEPLALERNYPDLHYLLAELLRSAGELERSEEAYSRALEANSRYAEALTGRAGLNRRRGRLLSVLEDLKQCLDASSSYVPAWLELASVLEEAGSPGKALRCYEMVVRICPHHSIAQQRVLDLRGTLEELTADLSRLKEAVELHPDFPDYHLELARRCLAFGMLAESRKHCRKAMRRNPDLLEAGELMRKVSMLASNLPAALAG